MLLPGDVLGFQDSNSLIVDEPDDALEQRFAQKAVCATGPLWGRGQLPSGADCQALEVASCEPCKMLCEGLESAGLSQERRVLLLLPQGFEWHWAGDQTLQLAFRLPKGTFATSVLREIIDYREGVSSDHTVIE